MFDYQSLFNWRRLDTFDFPAWLCTFSKLMPSFTSFVRLWYLDLERLSQQGGNFGLRLEYLLVHSKLVIRTSGEMVMVSRWIVLGPVMKRSLDQGNLRTILRTIGLAIGNNHQIQVLIRHTAYLSVGQHGVYLVCLQGAISVGTGILPLHSSRFLKLKKTLFSTFNSCPQVSLSAVWQIQITPACYCFEYKD